MTTIADDWPQWMGPQRDNVWREDGLLQKFPESGPTIKWRQPIAGGYSGPAVFGDVVVVTDYVTSENVKVDNFQRQEFTGEERVLCLNRESGEVLWKHQYPVKYTMSYPAGPRCTPAIEGNAVYTLGAEGHLHCFDLKTGDVRWSKNFQEDYGAKTALWGYASHPLIAGEKLICIVGGEGSHAVAFDKRTGEEIWRTLSSQEQGYSPPKVFEIAGRPQLILASPSFVAGVNPEDGKVRWQVPYEATNGSLIMTPIQNGQSIYVGGYSNKNMLIQLNQSGDNAEIVWQDRPKNAISPVNVQPIRVENLIYGLDQNGLMYAMEMKTGDRIWETGAPVQSERPLGSATAFVVQQADRFWLFTEQGDLVIANISSDGYEELDRAHVIEPSNTAFGREVVWSMPAFANRCAYLRNDSEIICVDLSDAAKQ